MTKNPRNILPSEVLKVMQTVRSNPYSGSYTKLGMLSGLEVDLYPMQYYDELSNDYLFRFSVFVNVFDTIFNSLQVNMMMFEGEERNPTSIEHSYWALMEAFPKASDPFIPNLQCIRLRAVFCNGGKIVVQEVSCINNLLSFVNAGYSLLYYTVLLSPDSQPSFFRNDCVYYNLLKDQGILSSIDQDTGYCTELARFHLFIGIRF